ncbi:hypothetical protein B9T62_12545 [Paenibacillus donghaensis]|uniref:Uncharacterized protein n=1 Tax=Paenibacillus donghaensis TaxID=414771 RepID=A0A2Z2KEL5_9BACL|nr:hypothetical protein B9T62_12545 [Paenibacillus donghaensis]
MKLGELMTKYNIHSDFKKYENTKLPLNPLLLPLINTLISRSSKHLRKLSDQCSSNGIRHF